MSISMSFKQWLEMVGTGAIYDPKAKGDFQWAGKPSSMIKPKPHKKRKPHSI